MPKIISICELKDVVAVSRMCNETDEPIFIAGDSSGIDMVVMSIKTYNALFEPAATDAAIAEAEADSGNGRLSDAREGLKELREKYGFTKNTIA